MRIGISGASGGIGQALVAVLTQRRHQVIPFSRSAPPLLDVTWPPERIEAALADALAPGSLDGWVNLAGADIISPPLNGAPYEERLAALWRVDVLGTLRVCRCLPPYLAAGAQIVNVGWDDSAGSPPTETSELYGLAKGALEGFSRHLARRWLGRWRVNVVAPGWVRSRWGASLSPERQAYWAERLPHRRWLTAEEVATAIATLLETEQVTGQVWRINGVP